MSSTMFQHVCVRNCNRKCPAMPLAMLQIAQRNEVKCGSQAGHSSCGSVTVKIIVSEDYG
jgi:hypothetical protein